MTPPQLDPTRLASRTEDIIEVVVALLAPVNTRYWDRFNPEVLLPNDNSEDESLDSNDMDDDSGYDQDSDSSCKQKEEVIVLFDNEPKVQMVSLAVAAEEGDKNLPINVEELPEVPDASIIIKEEV
ncbi:hypothetical protein D1007_61413 [Hordeum vulgare]|nr:hypothetical protein D1007_61413 [Hordeum vulgare]